MNYELIALYNNKSLKEGDELEFDGKIIVINHITLSGFLYNKTIPGDDYVTVTTESRTRTYYSNWDYLEFVECEVKVEYKPETKKPG